MKKNGRYLWLFFFVLFNISGVKGNTEINPISIKKIHLIFKTHLDIGFTNSGDSVVNTYMHDFIPNTLSIAESLRIKGGKERYVWTTGSWLISKFLKQSDIVMVKKMEEAIKRGEINWHALPFSTHTELADSSLFELGLQISKQLDKRFGKNTISAKMTDVPGHTRSLIPILSRNGIRFLHIGVNSASTMPDVPPLFKWLAPDGSSIIVMYQQGYGNQLVLPGTGTLIDIRFTNDNHGPHSIEQIKSIYKELHKKYPNAEIVASTLDDIAHDVIKIEQNLPVITQEIGDTWIHGIESDPKLVSEFRALSRLRMKWIKEGSLLQGGKQDLDFGIPLLMIAEHTWGRDVKTFLKDWDIYLPQDFRQARSKSNFIVMEQSWKEKRKYIQKAIETLSAEKKIEALKTLETLNPVHVSLNGYSELKKVDKMITTKYYDFQLDSLTGAIVYLKDKITGNNWATKEHPLLVYSYQTFSHQDYERFLSQYLIKKAKWALEDFGKPGLEKFDIKSQVYHPTLISAFLKEGRNIVSVVLRMKLLSNGNQIIWGAPTDLELELRFPTNKKEIWVSVKCFGKQASRLPEASWISFIPLVEQGEWSINKMGMWVNFQDIVNHGNRKMHACSDGVELKYKNTVRMFINSLDTPLAMFGNSSLLDFNNELPQVEEGVHFCLHNNVWGTNFSMWFDEDMLYRFVIR